MLASVLERKAGAGNEILHGLGDEDLGRSCECPDPSADVYGDASDPIASEFHLARV